MILLDSSYTLLLILCIDWVLLVFYYIRMLLTTPPLCFPSPLAPLRIHANKSYNLLITFTIKLTIWYSIGALTHTCIEYWAPRSYPVLVLVLVLLLQDQTFMVGTSDDGVPYTIFISSDIDTILWHYCFPNIR